MVRGAVNDQQPGRFLGDYIVFRYLFQELFTVCVYYAMYKNIQVVVIVGHTILFLSLPSGLYLRQ